ncbi:PspC domain-containing protein [Leucobacter albus]|uniref:PspC domain-containing protein n=1 Tax=Leucobacter albus TaxID=272210 RepID=A0ABW3TMJ6_9MICO
MSTTHPPRGPLTRSPSERLLAGVCGGLAEHLRVPVIAVRVTMLALALAGGAGVMLYLWLWGTVPLADAASPVAPMRRALTREAQTPSVAPPRVGQGSAAARSAAPRGTALFGTAAQSAAAPSTAAPGAAASGAAGSDAGGPGRAAPGTAPLSEAAHPSAVHPPAAHPSGMQANPVHSGARTPAAAAAEPAALPAAEPAALPAAEPSARTAVAGGAGGGNRAAAAAAAAAVAPAPTREPHGPTSGADGDDAARPRTRWPVAELLLGACLLLVGVLLVVQRLGVELRLSVILPGLAVLVGVGLTWWQIADRNRPDTNSVPRVLGALALVAVGILMFFVTAEDPNVWTVIAAALAALAGVALAIAPWLLRLNRELIAERAGREREAERAEIAAHLHDSVLQTLALIQQRSAPGSEVARLARGQERELREWLFRAADGGSAAPRETALEELRAHAATLENAHAVRFETVGVGAEVQVPEPIVAAAREAMLNAAQHAGGEVTVYAEVTPDRVSIDITDRGPGLDPERLPEGRMGVRESILGRMSRAGGTAKIVPGPGGNGTSVRLELPREPKHDAASDAGTGATL